MDIKYDSYLDRGTKRILEIFSSEGVTSEERETVVAAFTEELSNNIGNTDGLRDYDPLIYNASVNYNDSIITQVLSNKNASYQDYELGVNSCQRLQRLFTVFKEKGWALPDVQNASPEECAELFRHKQESISIGEKILDEDKQIDQLIVLAQKELSVDLCDKAIMLVHELEQDMTICRQKQIPVPIIKNTDTQGILQHIAALRQTSEQKEALYKSLYDTDQQIRLELSDYVNLPNQWQKLVSLSQKQEELLTECRNRRWPVPELMYSRPDSLSAKYQHLISMVELDDIITIERNALTTKAQYRAFFSHCKIQQENITTCTQNGWDIPSLSNPDPGSLKLEMQEKKDKKDKKRNLIVKLCLAGVALVAVAIIILVSIHLYRENKVQVPFDASFVIGQDQNDIYKELKEAGFSNIKRKQDYSGWLAGDKVISVRIDNSNTFSAGSYRNPNTEVVITYSSSDRIDVTEILKSWQGSEYERLINSLRLKGFSNIEASPIDTENRLQNRRVIRVSLNEKEYYSGPCYLPQSAPIKVEYYILQIAIGHTAKQFENNQMYTQVVNQLEAQGFINIRLQRANDIGWFPIHSPEGSVKQLTINGNHDFEETDKFRYDSEIIIIVHTKEGQGCEDITEIAE